MQNDYLDFEQPQSTWQSRTVLINPNRSFKQRAILAQFIKN